MGGPQDLLCVGGDVGLERRAGKFSLVTVRGVVVGLAVEVVGLGAVVAVGDESFPQSSGDLHISRQ